MTVAQQIGIRRGLSTNSGKLKKQLKLTDGYQNGNKSPLCKEKFSLALQSRVSVFSFFLFSDSMCATTYFIILSVPLAVVFQLVRNGLNSVDKVICHCVVHLPNNSILLHQLEQLQSIAQELIGKYDRNCPRLSAGTVGCRAGSYLGTTSLGFSMEMSPGSREEAKESTSLMFDMNLRMKGKLRVG